MERAREQVTGWLTRVVELHDNIISEYGGAEGILDPGLLAAAIERTTAGLSDGTRLFPTDQEKAAVLLERIIQYHPFVDGNKRTAAMLAFEFLREHGYSIEVSEREIVDVVVQIARKEMAFSDILAWVGRIARRQSRQP